jgi:hypothetical protein
MIRLAVACAVVALATIKPVFAYEACDGQWAVPPTFKISQENGFVVTFYRMEQTGEQFAGRAHYKSKNGEVDGFVHGGIARKDGSFGARIVWDPKPGSTVSVGRYLGLVNVRGHVHDGDTYDENAHPAVSVKWSTIDVLKCLTGKMETPKPQPAK